MCRDYIMVSIPYRLATNSNDPIEGKPIIDGFNSLQVGYKHLTGGMLSSMLVYVSIPYRLATNCCKVKTSFQSEILCFNSLQVGYKHEKDIIQVMIDGISFNSLQVGYKPSLITGKVRSELSFNSLQVGYKRATGI